MQGLCKEVLFLRNEYKGSRGWEAEDVDAWKETHMNMPNNQGCNSIDICNLRLVSGQKLRQGLWMH